MSQLTPSQFFQVSEIVSQIKFTLESQYKDVWVQGEISGLRPSGAGHFYFSLKDSKGLLSCALFRGDAYNNPELKTIKEGDKIFVFGNIGVYSPRGTFQLIAKKIISEGKGGLQEKFDQLKLKLSQEGLFDLERKKAIPVLPSKVAIITALNGAALQDFLSIVRRRCHLFQIVIAPSLVQGEKAAEQVIQQLNRILKLSERPDVVVIARGGGSLEDLWSFNNENLARTVASYPLPVISAIGHESDFTLIDYVSDHRCETPSAAAELLSERSFQLQEQLRSLSMGLKSRIAFLLLNKVNALQRRNPEKLLQALQAKLHIFWRRLHRCGLHKRPIELLRIHEFHQQLDEAKERMGSAVERKLEQRQQRLEKSFELLQAYHPQNILKRGYCFIKHDEHFVRSLGLAKKSSGRPSYRYSVLGW